MTLSPLSELRSLKRFASVKRSLTCEFYTCENTCLLSVYGRPTWDMYRRVKDREERDTFCWAYKHVIVVCAKNEDPKHKILPAPVESGMQPGCAYLVFTIGGFEAGVFKKHAWLMKDVLLLDTPFLLASNEKPTRGPTKLRSSLPGHKELLATINSMRTIHADTGPGQPQDSSSLQPPGGFSSSSDGLSL